jgi:ABC-2 type transport system permease protein
VYFSFLILGGIWYPLSGALKTVGQLTPTYQAVKIGTDIIEGVSVSMGLAIGLVVWLAIFIGLAVVAVRGTAETV